MPQIAETVVNRAVDSMQGTTWPDEPELSSAALCLMGNDTSFPVQNSSASRMTDRAVFMSV